MAVTARNIRADRIRRLKTARKHDCEEVPLLDSHDAGLAEEASQLDLESLSPADYKLACQLLEGYTLEEIAQAEGVCASAVKMRLSRIRSEKSQ
jgi:DNA-directed RNA polymerase specialized sigma24 family protein